MPGHHSRRIAMTALALSFLVYAGCPRETNDEDARLSSLSQSQIESGLADREASVDGCVSRAQNRNPRVSGDVVVSGRIGTDGRVESVIIARSDVEDRRLEECILRAVQGARFPDAGTVTEFEHAFTVARSRSRVREAEAPGDLDFAQPPGDDEEEGPPQLDSSSIDRLVEEHRQAFNNCYVSALQEDSELAGDIEVSWAVAPDGSVPSAVVTGGSLDDSGMHDCVAGVVRGWRFAPTGAAGFQQASYVLGFAKEE